MLLSEAYNDNMTNGTQVSVATPQNIPEADKSKIKIASVAVCAGSGGSLFRGLINVDCLFTGELSHHEALAAIEEGKVVITTFHSNSERQYLEDVMKPMLKSEIERSFHESAYVEGQPTNTGSGSTSGEEFDVVVSSMDKDPYEFVMPGSKGW
jgi:putative NIF3 family GTP cyclohydrolase 1 type 2